MRKFFGVFLGLSLLVTAGALYWRTAHPEGAGYRSTESGTRGFDGASGYAGERFHEADRMRHRETFHDGVHKRVGAFFDNWRSYRHSDSRPSARPPVDEEASDRQDWAVTISVGSSLISAIGALAQVWLTAKGVRADG